MNMNMNMNDVGSFSSHRLVLASDDDPFRRGFVIGQELGFLAKELHGLLSGVWYAHMDKDWEIMSLASYDTLSTFCPIAFAELRGYAAALGEKTSEEGQERKIIGDELKLLLMLGCERELGMLNAQKSAGFKSPPLGPLYSSSSSSSSGGPNDCSGMIYKSTTRSILGHANDLTPEFYLDGRATRVCCLKGADKYPTCICINFAGVGCIGGVNAAGLAISRFTVDTGERNLLEGVPVNFLVRETLTKCTLDEAVDFLRSCPRTLPYGFHISCRGKAIGIECSPSAFTVRDIPFSGASIEPGMYCGARANHCMIDSEMIRAEIGAHHLPALKADDKSSASRQAAMERSLYDLFLLSEADTLKGVKSALLKSPVTNETTMVCFVAESSSSLTEARSGVLHVQFYGEGNAYHTYGTAVLDGITPSEATTSANITTTLSAVTTISSSISGGGVQASVNIPSTASTSVSSRMKLNDERDLLASCERGNLQNVKRFIMKGVDIECRDSIQNTPLICASHYGYCDIVLALLEANANKDAVNRNGTSSLLAASFYGHFSIVQILLEYRADENLEDRHGDSALIKAADSGHEAICAIILMYGANYMTLKRWLNKTNPSTTRAILPNTAVVTAAAVAEGRAKGGSILNLANQQEAQSLNKIRKLVAQMPIIWISYVFAQGLNIALDAIDVENMFQFY